MSLINAHSPFNGSVVLRSSGVQGAGVLLWTGRHILTVAHFASSIGTQQELSIQYVDDEGIQVSEVASVTVHPGWSFNSNNFNNDIAIIELAEPLPASVSRYDLYRNFDERGQDFTRVGYSANVNPVSGKVDTENIGFHQFDNIYDVTTDAVNSLIGSSISKGTQLSYDFDNGLVANDAYGLLLGQHDLGLGSAEGFARSGDSGSPAFIDNKIAGLASYIFNYDVNGLRSDVNEAVDSTYGEIASDTRVSVFADWIDTVVENNAAPKNKSEVDLFPIEADSKNTLNYFLLSLNSVSENDAYVSYKTEDGTAKAGLDYITNEGIALIPAGKSNIAIPVEIVADTIDEEDEFFYLTVFDPQGGAFPDKAESLQAKHTIIDNDAQLISSVGTVATHFDEFI